MKNELIKSIKNNALNLIKQDFKEIEENTIKENTPKEDVIYSLVDGTNEKSIVNGNTWNDSEYKSSFNTKDYIKEVENND